MISENMIRNIFQTFPTNRISIIKMQENMHTKLNDTAHILLTFKIH